MPTENIKDRVVKIVSEQLGVKRDDAASAKSLIADLGADSLDSMELVMAVEDEFAIEVPDEDLPKFDSVDSIVAYLETATLGA